MWSSVRLPMLLELQQGVAVSLWGLGLHIQTQTLSLLCSHVIWYFYSNLCCCLRHSAFQFAYGSWSTDCLCCMLLADSRALGESVCPPFYVNNSLQRQFSSELVGGPCLVEEVKFSVASHVLSQKAFTFKLTTHLLPATKDVYDVTLTRY